ncbi:MAG: ADP-ribosylglycohydrolase family protein, partial [Alistipes sp.]|nr:ADP-ribosylglycohydrolase family protein [Alistipes sp.]
YALAFVCDDIPTLIRESLRTLPDCNYRRCMEDVIRFHREFPDDWRRCWLEIERRYGYEKGCPEGVFNGFNIDAVINSAYVVMGLLYGDGDFEKTMDISTRCGQDSDCNPASAAGILGVMMGYEAIPDKWKPAMDRVVDVDFPYTSISLNKIYDLNLELMKEITLKNGGTVSEDGVWTFALQEPVAVPFEESFSTIEPVERRVLKLDITDSAELTFEGNSVVVMGQVRKLGLEPDKGYIARIDAEIDGVLVEQVEMPYDYIKRKYDIFYIYELPTSGKHTLRLKWTNPDPHYVIEAKEMVVYKAKEE